MVMIRKERKFDAEVEGMTPLHKSSNGLADGKIRLRAKINF